VAQKPIETLESPADEQALRRKALSPRLVAVLCYDRLDAPPSLVVELDEVDEVIVGGGGPDVVRRGRSLEIALDDPYASRRHARIRVGDRLVVEDLGSRNGTAIGGRPLVGPTILDEGGALEVGHTVLVLRHGPRRGPLTTELGPTRSASPAFASLAERLRRLAPTEVSLLLVGETGTGKEVLARHVHQLSGRSGPFVAVNCGALVEGLVESELFGHRRGAFTGATGDRRGYVEAAHQGTLFLDEIGELPPSAQTRLLRVLDAREVVPVGSVQPVRVDVRVVAATHRDLERLVGEQRFRADLYARLAGWVGVLPPLRDRREDLGALVAHALEGRGRRSCTVTAGRALVAHDWPLNVRGLVKAIEAAAVLAEGRPIELADLPNAVAPTATSEPPPLPDDEEDEELRQRVLAALRAHQGNVTQAAVALGKHRQQLQRWMRRLRIEPTD